MHTYFTINNVSVDQLQAAIQQGANQALKSLNSALNRSYLYRITQPNGIPLLFAGALVLLWILWTLIVLPLMHSKVRDRAYSSICCMIQGQHTWHDI